MCCPPLILLLITGALLIPTEGQGDLLSIVNMAIKHGNQIPEKPEKHMNFYRTLKQKKGSKLLSTEVLLRATD
uniref:Uncharacterized protein n=1 Tax=Anguilla anguilla TaxID=7936 RepID=A0A0E9UVB3_ANGAN